MKRLLASVFCVGLLGSVSATAWSCPYAKKEVLKADNQDNTEEAIQKELKQDEELQKKAKKIIVENTQKS